MSACICATQLPGVRLKKEWITSSRKNQKSVFSLSLSPFREEFTALQIIIEQARHQGEYNRPCPELFRSPELFRDLMSFFILQGDLQLALKYYHFLERSQKEELWRLFQKDVTLFRISTEELTDAAQDLHAQSGDLSLSIGVECLKQLYCHVLLLTTRVRLPLFLEMYEEAEWSHLDYEEGLSKVYKELFSSNFLILSMLRAVFVRAGCEKQLIAIDPMTVLSFI